MECGALNSIKISKSHHVKKKEAPVYDVNTKGTRGLVHSGWSAIEMLKFLVSAKTLKGNKKCYIKILPKCN